MPPHAPVSEIACADAARRLWDYVDARLPETSRAEIDAHLATCAACPGHVTFARAIQRALAASRALSNAGVRNAVLRARLHVVMSEAQIARPLRVVVLGAGGVGGYFGGALARAGHDVTLLARGDHLAAIRARGLQLKLPTDDGTPTAESVVAPVKATDDADALPHADLVLVTVKSYSLHEIAPAAARLARAGATVLPLLNGVDAADRLVEYGVPREALLGGVTVISAARVGPGVIERRSAFQRVVVGTLRGTTVDTARVNRIVQAFHDAGVDARVSSRIEVELWNKLIFLASMAAACGLARREVGAVRSAPLGRLLIERAIAEIVAVARAHGVAVDPDITAQTVGAIEALPATMRPSLLLDLERGGPTELDVLSGAVSRLGRQHGIPTPVHDTAVAAIGAATAGS